MNREYRRKYLFDFAKEKFAYKNKFYKIIYFAKNEDVYRIIKSVNNSSSLTKKLEKILFPQSIHDMGTYRLVLNTDLSLDFLMKYYCIVFEQYRTKIETYIKLKTEFEKKLFQRHYSEALEVLYNIESTVGLSVWGIAKKLYLFEKVYDLEKHKKFLNEIQAQASDNILLNTLFELESYFAEDNTSYMSFKKKLEGYNEILQDNELIRKYLDFKFNVEREYDPEEIGIALMFDAQFSIIDMYETYVVSEQMRFVEGMVDDNCWHINDHRLDNMLFISSPKEIPSHEEYYYLLDLYTSGNYIKFIDGCDDYLVKNPQDIQCIILLVKAYIMLGKIPIFNNDIYTWFYNSYMVNELESEAIQNLFSYIKVARGTSWEYKIIGFIARKTSMPNRHRLEFFSSINDIKVSPNWIQYECIKNKVAFLNVFSKACPITYNLFLFKCGVGEIPAELTDINRRLLFETDRHIQEGEFQEALRTVSKISRKDDYFLERIMRRQMRIFEQSGDFLSEVECVTYAILKNPNLQKRIDISLVSSKINCNLSSEIKKSISYVVFEYLSMPSDYKKQRIAYSNYMDLNNYQCVDDVINHECRDMMLVAFLDRVCVQHLLKRDIILNPEGNQSEEIRIDILKKLIQLDSGNRKKYYAEISVITKQRSIKDRIKQINQSRVFVDTENIKKENEAALREDFDRYLSVRELDDEIKTYDIYSSAYIQDLKKIVDDMNDKIRNNVTYSQKIVILKGIITNITEEFLFNEKYGLNTFLSSRIRHGYCKNQLTTIFQEFNLLSKKKKNDSNEYLINEYWDNILPDKSDGANRIKECLSVFTSHIENKVDEIKKEWLSIRYKEDSNALLDYTLCVNHLLVIDNDNIIDFNSFYDQVIETLWDYTLNHFDVLKGKIQGELLNFFQTELNQLASGVGNVREEDVKDTVKIILNNINMCKSKIGGKTIEFANVFEKRDVSYLDFTMGELIDTCLHIILKLNGGMADVVLTKNICDTNYYKGENFPYFVDAVNILINNALEHSGISDYSKLKIVIDINKIEDEVTLAELRKQFEKKHIRIDNLDFIGLSVTNNLAEDVEINVLTDTVEKIFKNTNNTETVRKYSQSEGGTGLYKLYKTFQYNINTAYLFTYAIDRNSFCISIIFGVMNILA